MFPKDFTWGVASSAYQIEGKDASDGSGQNVWDAFVKQEGKIYGHHNGDVACDHIHRYKEDFALMQELGITSYRFSLDWAKILPDGVGRVNEKAIALYRDMIMEMKKRGITPYVTMFHWEFPLKLYEKEGWLNEESVEWFGEYAKVVAENFSDLAEYFITLNEPQCFIGLGHLKGSHAPGLTLEPKQVFQIAHDVLKAHGKAVLMLRKYAKQPIKIGYAPTCGVAYPFTESKEDIEAARTVYFDCNQPIDNWTWNVSWFSDPVFLGHYPEDGLEKFGPYLPEITQEDMELIHQPLDFMGQNIYNGYWIRQGKDGKPENGMACRDVVAEDGGIHDSDRIQFLNRYLSSLQRAVEEGVDVAGYFLWTFMDNFEWERGYSQRFGTVYVDFETQKRIPKDSAYWYKEICRTNGAILNDKDGNISCFR